jgi:hypothetical protein
MSTEEVASFLRYSSRNVGRKRLVSLVQVSQNRRRGEREMSKGRMVARKGSEHDEEIKKGVKKGVGA